MSRFLIVTLPLAGHVNPPAAVSRVLQERGHDVAWCGSVARLRPWLGPDATVYPTGMRAYGGLADNGLVSVKSLWESFIVPFTRHTLPAVEKAVAQFQPDVLVVDQHALAGALVAQRHDIPWATFCTSTMEVGAPFARLPKAAAWIRGHLETLSAEAGLADDQGIDLRFSPYLVIVFSSGLLLGAQDVPGHFALVGRVVEQAHDGELPVGAPRPGATPRARHRGNHGGRRRDGLLPPRGRGAPPAR